jgi:hypothetical protein
MEYLGSFWSQFYFENISRLDLLFGVAALVVLWFIFWGWRIYRRSPPTKGSIYPRIGTIKFWLFVSTVLALVVVAWALPYSSQSKIAYRRGSVEVIFLVDGSASMFLQGIGMARIDVATREILKLLSAGTLREGDRAALFIFGKISSRRVYLTRSLSDLFATEVSRIGRPKTLLENEFPWGSAIVPVLQHVYQSCDKQDKFAEFGPREMPNWQPAVRTNRLIVLLSDGDFFNYLGDEIEITEDEVSVEKNDLRRALFEIRRRGWKIYPVGIGRISGEKLSDILKDYQRETEYGLDLERELGYKTSRLDVANLEEVARMTGGSVFLIENASVDAGGFLKKMINGHRPLSFEPMADVDKQEWWPYFLMMGLILLVVGIIFY